MRGGVGCVSFYPSCPGQQAARSTSGWYQTEELLNIFALLTRLVRAGGESPCLLFCVHFLGPKHFASIPSPDPWNVSWLVEMPQKPGFGIVDMKGHIWDMPPMADQRNVWTYTISFLPYLSLEVYTSIQSLVDLAEAGANRHLPPPTPIPCHTHTLTDAICSGYHRVQVV